MADVMDEIRKEIAENKVLIYMKGTPSFPQCGFSARTIDVFEDLGYPYATVNVLADPEKREAVKTFSNWPTIPQVYIDGKFIGGCDVVSELYETGELDRLLKEAHGEAAPAKS
jgi:monothiol glutaredoxin